MSEIEEAKKTINDVKWAMMNWEERLSKGWQQYIDKLILHIDELINYIEENV